MNEEQQRFLEVFPQWLGSLPDDARGLSSVLVDDGSPDVHRRWAAAALSYLVRSIDLIPDGVEELGFIDDAFVLRVSAARALNATAPSAGTPGTVLARLAAESTLIAEFMGDLYSRLSAFVSSLPGAGSAERSVESLMSEPDARVELLRELDAWSASYTTPKLTGDERVLVKLRSFLDAKLP